MAVKVARIPKFRVNFLTSQYFGEYLTLTITMEWDLP